MVNLLISGKDMLWRDFFFKLERREQEMQRSFLKLTTWLFLSLFFFFPLFSLIYENYDLN